MRGLTPVFYRHRSEFASVLALPRWAGYNAAMKHLRLLADADVQGKRVLVRVDHNVESVNGKLKTDTKIRASLPTLKHLLKEGARIILLTHVGRPKGKAKPEPPFSTMSATRKRMSSCTARKSAHFFVEM